jgi:hypothetical protein
MPGAFLIYVYNVRSHAIDPDLAELTRDRLLLLGVALFPLTGLRGGLTE